MNDLKDLKKILKKFSIIVKYYIITDVTTVVLERWGMIIKFDEAKLLKETPKRSVRLVLKAFRHHAKYQQAIDKHIEKLRCKNDVDDTDSGDTDSKDTTIKTKVNLPSIITIDDKKRRIRTFLIEEGILTN